jgi:hypothetical protein
MLDPAAITDFSADPEADVYQDVAHFTKLARHGRHAGASGGAKRARQLALCILNHAPGLDSMAVDGLVDFVRLTIAAPTSARDLLR